MDDTDKPATERANKTKEEALELCVEQHVALVKCFKTCGVSTILTGCCYQENKAFWDCYAEERGSNASVIQVWLDNKLGRRSKADSKAPERT